MGISNAGNNAEEEFRALTGASKTARAADGDAILEGHLVEIKQASKNTLNQVRAVKYLPLVVLHTPSQQWYVIPPDEVIRMVSHKSRGQHTENPFESATLSLTSLGKYKIAGPEYLRDSTLDAFQQGARWPELRVAMEEIRQQSSELAKSSIEKVRQILESQHQPDTM